MEELSTKAKGDISELRAFARLRELGFQIYIPFGEDSRCDAIIEDDGELTKIQVKTGTELNENKFKFNCRSTRSNFTETVESGYDGEIDAFVVYYPKRDNLYYIRINEAPKTMMCIRHEESKVANDNCNMESDYLLTNRLK